MAHPERLELPTKWFEATYSIQLSYGCGGLAGLARGAIILRGGSLVQSVCSGRRGSYFNQRDFSAS